MQIPLHVVQCMYTVQCVYIANVASTVYIHIHYLTFTDSPAASCSVVDGEEKQTTLTVAERSCKMGGVKGAGMGRGRDIHYRRRKWWFI